MKVYVLTVLTGEFELMQTFVVGAFSSEELATKAIAIDLPLRKNEWGCRSLNEGDYSIDTVTLDTVDVGDEEVEIKR